jgi:hypothetical protein
MMKDLRTKKRSVQLDLMETWAACLHRRVMHLLFLLDAQLFSHRFHDLYRGSSFSLHPLFQCYDQHRKLLALSKELLEDILPGIHREWSQDIKHETVYEESPVHGPIDWQKTVERASNEMPDQSPQQFAVLQRQENSELPENLLTVAILLHCQKYLQDMLLIDQEEKMLTSWEHQHLVNIEDRLEQELALLQLYELLEKAQESSIDILVEHVHASLYPGSSSYRDLLTWWEQFSELQSASSVTNSDLRPTHLQKQNEQEDFWLYELWIVLELIAFLHEQNALVVDTLTLARDQLHFIFVWKSERYHFLYQRKGMIGGNRAHHWEHTPTAHPSYTIKRDKALTVEHKGRQIWQEPPVVIDLAYALDDNGAAIQNLFGSMAMYATEAGLLISPYLADPQANMQMSGEVLYEPQRYNHRAEQIRVGLYKLMPDMPTEFLQERLVAMLQHSITKLPERPQPMCYGIVLDQDSSNASGKGIQEFDVLCPKPHIGPSVYDLVSRTQHCLKDPRLCHAIGQVIIPPQVKRVTSLDDFKRTIEQLREYGEELLKQAEEERDEEKVEQIRSLILQQMGEKIEQYVRMRGNTAMQEKFLHDGLFKGYWDKHGYCLELDTRNILISGEYIWDDCRDAQLNDWAALAVQYCRALEREIKRRFYMPVQSGYTIKANKWTLGSIKSMYNEGHPGASSQNWQTFVMRAAAFHIDETKLIQQFVDPMVVKVHISDLRNRLAHGEPIDKAIAIGLRDAILGSGEHSGLLDWLVRNIGP